MNTLQAQITYRHCIARQLGLTYLEYENLRYQFFIDWCINLCCSSLGGQHLKTLIAHDSFLNWYDDQWNAMVEQTLERHYGNDITLFNSEDVLLLLNLYAENILNYYPQVLLKKIRGKK